MTGTRPVASLAGDARHCTFSIQLIVGHRSGCMTGKTCPTLCRRHAPSHGLFTAAGRGRRLPRRNIQILERRKKSQMTLVVAAVLLVHISLPHATNPKGPQQIYGKRTRVIAAGDHQTTFPAFGYDLLPVGTNTK